MIHMGLTLVIILLAIGFIVPVIGLVLIIKFYKPLDPHYTEDEIMYDVPTEPYFSEPYVPEPFVPVGAEDD